MMEPLMLDPKTFRRIAKLISDLYQTDKIYVNFHDAEITLYRARNRKSKVTFEEKFTRESTRERGRIKRDVRIERALCH